MRFEALTRQELKQQVADTLGRRHGKCVIVAVEHLINALSVSADDQVLSAEIEIEADFRDLAIKVSVR